MKNYKRYEDILVISLLFLSAFAALGLSAIATYHFFASFGILTAVLAVIAIEVSIPAVIFSIKPSEKLKSKTGWVAYLIIVLSVVMAIVVAMAANLIWKVDTLGITLSERFMNALRLGATTFVIPLLALVAVERLRISLGQRVPELFVEAPKKTVRSSAKRQERIEYLKERYANPDDIHIELESKKLGVSGQTIQSYIREIRESDDPKGF